MAQKLPTPWEVMKRLLKGGIEDRKRINALETRVSLLEGALSGTPDREAYPAYAFDTERSDPSTPAS